MHRNNTSSTADDEQIAGRIWTGDPGPLMNTLCYDIGPRPPASLAMREAQSLLAETFRSLGARNVHAEEVPVRTWKPEPSGVELCTPANRIYESFHHIHTAAADVTAHLVDGGFGTAEDLDRVGAQCKWAAVLIHGFEIAGSGGKFVPIQRRVGNALERGAAAVVVRSLPESLLPTVELVGVDRNVPIPVAGVSASAGFELAHFAAQGHAQIRVQTGGSSGQGTCSNLVAELGPAGADDEAVVLSAHLDTFFNNPGAFDNLTGVCTLMEIARALAPLQERFRRTLRLVVFTAEEYGFVGSKSYVAAHAHDLDLIRFVFNMDSLFDDTARGVAVMWSPAMRDYIDAAFASTGLKIDVRNLFCMSSDYLPFLLTGIPAARPARWGGTFPPQSHTILDMPDRVPIDWIRANALGFAILMGRLVMNPNPLPATRLSPETVHEFLEMEDVIELLRLYDFQL